MSYARDTLDFARLMTKDDNDKEPLIAISASSAETTQTFTVNLYDSSDWLCDGCSYPLRRRSSITDGRYQFQIKSNYYSTDADYTGAASPSTVYFVFFAVAYGTDPASPWTSVYSDPSLLDSGAVAYSPKL
jgi:hypothetical protein